MSDLTDLIVKLIKQYKLDPDAAHRGVKEMYSVFNEELSDDDVTFALEVADQHAASELTANTLISTRSASSHKLDSSNEDGVALPIGELKTKLRDIRLEKEVFAELENLSVEEYLRQRRFSAIAEPHLEEDLLSEIIERIGDVLPVLDVLSRTRFQTIRSAGVRRLIEEAHINFLLGLESGAVTLFWSAIELTLKERLTARGFLDEIDWKLVSVETLLDDAEDRLGLKNEIRVEAEEVYELRKLAIHNWPALNAGDISKRMSLVEKSRRVLSEIYKLDES